MNELNETKLIKSDPYHYQKMVYVFSKQSIYNDKYFNAVLPIAIFRIKIKNK